MASYSYAGLTVNVTADTRQLTSKVATDAAKAGEDAGKSISKGLSGVGGALSTIGRGAVTALAGVTAAAVAFGVESFKAASRASEMDDALKGLAKSTGTSYAAMTKAVDATRANGVATSAAQQLVAKFAINHLSLAKAVDLSTVAQNAGIIAGKSTTDTLNILTKAVTSQRTMQLKNLGLNVNATQAMTVYAKSIGTTAKNLTAAQRSQAILNAILQAGTGIAGVYAKAMNDPARVLADFPRLFDSIKESVGAGLVTAFSPVILATHSLGSALDAALMPGGALAPVLGAVGRSVGQLLTPVTMIMTAWTKWIANVKPGQFSAVASDVGKLAPVLASVATAASVFTGGKILGDIPVLGGLLGDLGGPLGAAAAGLGMLALQSPVARKAIGEIISQLASGLAPVMRALAPLLGELGAALGQVLGAALQALVPLIPPLVVVLQALVAVIIPLVPLITFLADQLARFAPVLVPLVLAWEAYGVAVAVVTSVTEANVIAQLAARSALVAVAIASAWETTEIIALYTAQYIVRGATLAWAAAQWVLNAALDANPIGLVIIGLVALGAALVLAWQRSAAFRDVVEAAWRDTYAVVAPIIGGLVRIVVTGFDAMRAVVNSVTGWIHANWQWLMLALVAIATGGLGALVLLTIRYWGQIRAAVASATGAVQAAVVTAWTNVRNFSSAVWAQITSIVSSAWSRMVSGALSAGGQVIAGLRSGMESAMRGIGGWVKSIVVDPIVSAVKGFFGIHSPSTVMEGIGGNLISGLVRGVMHNSAQVVKTIFGGWPSALASVLGKGLATVTSLPGKAISALSHLGGAALGALSKLGGLFGGGGGGGGTGQYRGLMATVLSMFGIPQLLGTFMTQMNTESGGNARAINLSDSNAAAGTPSKGLMQVIDPTFNAYAGPFRSRGIWDPLANIYAAVAYSIARYGSSIAAVLGHGHGYKLGGTLFEPVAGIGLRSGEPYSFAENGPERWSPLQGGMTAAERALNGKQLGPPVTINVYPRQQQSETEIAAAVSRELAWATAGGAT
jgi:SLT domain-containing protein